MTDIFTLDLNFQNRPGAIATYLIPHPGGAALVECGPGSTVAGLLSGLAVHGFTVRDVTDVFLTHIHLDHAGAAGWLAQQGARIHVHPAGAPHLLNPEKLLASASRIYGDRMAVLWGDFLPVPEASLSVLQDDAVVELGQVRIQALDTPGHANHHFCYLVDGVCFTGDVGGVRMAGLNYIRLPAPPPEFLPGDWRASIDRLSRLPVTHLAPTHFGLYGDPQWHFAAVLKALDEHEAWMEATLSGNLPLERLYGLFEAWCQESFLAAGLPAEMLSLYEVGSPAAMSVDGLARYWRKFRTP